MSNNYRDTVALYHPEGEASYIVQDLRQAASIVGIDSYVYSDPYTTYRHIPGASSVGLILAGTGEAIPAKRRRAKAFDVAQLVVRVEAIRQPVIRITKTGKSYGGDSVDEMWQHAREEFMDNAAGMMWQMRQRGHFVHHYSPPFRSGVIIRPVVLHDDQVASRHEVPQAGVETERVALEA